MGNSIFKPSEEYHDQIRAVCDRLIPIIQKTARDCGWCAAVHGSKIRDLDIIATPWVSDAGSVDTFLAALQTSISAEMKGECYLTPQGGEIKPHGRIAFSIFINSDEIVSTPAGAYPFVDISVVDSRYQKPVCTCLSSLEVDAYGSGGPMSGKLRPAPCVIHPNQDGKRQTMFPTYPRGPIKD